MRAIFMKVTLYINPTKMFGVRSEGGKPADGFLE
jgi:hypothetical protein